MVTSHLINNYMEQSTITIKKVYHQNKEGKAYMTKNGQPFVRFQDIAGEYYTDFQNSIWNEGAIYDITFEKGNFGGTIKSRTEPQGNQAIQNQANVQEHKQKETRKEEGMAWGNAKNVAGLLIAHGKFPIVGDGDVVKSLYTLARQIYALEAPNGEEPKYPPFESETPQNAPEELQDEYMPGPGEISFSPPPY